MHTPMFPSSSRRMSGRSLASVGAKMADCPSISWFKVMANDVKQKYCKKKKGKRTTLEDSQTLLSLFLLAIHTRDQAQQMGQWAGLSVSPLTGDCHVQTTAHKQLRKTDNRRRLDNGEDRQLRSVVWSWDGFPQATLKWLFTGSPKRECRHKHRLAAWPTN